MAAPSTTVVTISRQLASGGSFIGQQIARRLGLRYTDREILAHAARESGVHEADLEGLEERSRGFWRSVLRQYSLGAPEAPYVAPPVPLLYEDDLFALESAIIKRVAARFDAVIVGRAGFHVLADHPGLVSIRIYAPQPWRVRRAMELYGLEDERAARELIERSDQQRSAFVRAFTGRDWNDARAHHLCLDPSALGLELAADLAVRLVSARMEARRTSA
ncbi:MAG: AAA family ATPase [Acidobacteriota bacterium]